MTDEFISWHKEFVVKHSKAYTGKSYGVEASYSPNVKEWVERVDKSHIKLRDKIGGVTKTYAVCTSDAPQAPLSTVESAMCPISKIIPDYYAEYSLSYVDFRTPQLNKLKNRSGSKHILQYARRIKTPEDQLKELERAVERLGQIWAQYKTREERLYITLSTDPKAFSLLGRYQIDRSSCFRQGDFNSDKKYTLGAHENTFVALFHKKPEYKLEEDSGDFVARSMGMVTGDNLNIVNIFNHYPYNPTINAQGMLEVSKSLLETENVDVIDGMIVLKGGINYPEYSYAGKTFFDPEKTKIKRQYIKLDNRYSKEARGDYKDAWAE
jgi:hypothetical protein